MKWGDTRRSAVTSWLVLVALAGSSAVASGRPNSLTPTPDAPFRGQRPELTPEVPFVLPAFNLRTLPNGLTLIAVERLDTATISLQYVNRAAHDSGRAEDAGLAALTERAISEATLLADGRVVHGGSASDIELYGHANRFGSIFSLTALAEDADSGFAALARLVRFPAFDAGTLASVRKQQSQERYLESARSSTAVHRIAFEKLWGEGDPLALPSGAGHNRNLTTFTDETVRRFYQERYRPSQGALIVVGPITSQHALELAKRYFADWQEPAGNVAKPVLPREPALQSGSGLRLVGLKTNKSHANFELAAPCAGYADPDYIVFEVISALIDSSIQSPLYQELRLAGSGGYYLRANCNERRDGGNFSLWFDAGADTARAALRNVLGELERFARGRIGRDELEAARRAVASRWKQHLKTNYGLARHLTWSFLLDIPRDDVETFLRLLRGVTAARIQSVAQRYFKRSQLVVGFNGDPKVFGPALAEFGNIEWRDPWNPDQTGGAPVD